MGAEIIQHIGGREHQPPGKIQRTLRRAGAPAARCVAQGDGACRLLDRSRVEGDGGFDVAPRLRHQIVGDAPRHMRLAARHTQAEAAIVQRLDGDRAARASPVRDDMFNTAQRDDRARHKRNLLRQAAQAHADPCAVTLGKIARGLQRAARRHGQHHIAAGGAHTQRQPPRAGRAPDGNDIGLAAMGNVEARHLGGRRGDSPEQTEHAASLAAGGSPSQPCPGAAFCCARAAPWPQPHRGSAHRPLWRRVPAPRQ